MATAMGYSSSLGFMRVGQRLYSSAQTAAHFISAFRIEANIQMVPLGEPTGMTAITGRP
jgi:hypothetical protein